MIFLAVFKQNTNWSPFTSSTGTTSTQDKSFEEYKTKLLSEEIETSSDSTSNEEGSDERSEMQARRDLVTI